MKLLTAVLCTLVIVSLGIAVYSEIQRREDAKEVVRLQKTIAAQRKGLNSLKSKLEKPNDGYPGGGYPGGGYPANPYLKRNPYPTR